MFSYQNGHAEAAKGVQRFQALLLGLKRNFIVKKIECSILFGELHTLSFASSSFFFLSTCEVFLKEVSGRNI